MKGYKYTIGQSWNNGFIGMALSQKEARQQARKMLMVLQPYNKNKIKIFIRKANLKRCKSYGSYECNRLIEASDKVCLVCEDLMYEAQQEAREQKSREEIEMLNEVD